MTKIWKKKSCEIKIAIIFSFFFFPWRKQAFYFCHKSGCWKPCADPCRPITLRSFLIAVSSRGVWDPHLLTVLCSMRSQVKNKRYWWYRSSTNACDASQAKLVCKTSEIFSIHRRCKIHSLLHTVIFRN